MKKSCQSGEFDYFISFWKVKIIYFLLISTISYFRKRFISHPVHRGVRGRRKRVKPIPRNLNVIRDAVRKPFSRLNDKLLSLVTGRSAGPARLYRRRDRCDISAPETFDKSVSISWLFRWTRKNHPPRLKSSEAAINQPGRSTKSQ